MTPRCRCAMREIGFTEEADAFRAWLGGRVMAGEAPGGEPLQIMYRVDGDPHLAEEVLGHLEGWRGSAPVRAGNGAADQLQLDIYGEVVYALAQAASLTEAVGYDGWQRSAEILDWLCDHWDRPDEGILFSEEIGPTGEQLGNFPEAFTHLALITAALALDEELDRAPADGGWE
ncbi:glycoside hydrolase family 15 protein [Streptomyces goshikiensis]|uniref:glycoside hydrolase family 15 protein n=1 Tax=Streptomyces goshikiensis TaxID=1942 RepID=UPI0037207974